MKNLPGTIRHAPHRFYFFEGYQIHTISSSQIGYRMISEIKTAGRFQVNLLFS